MATEIWLRTESVASFHLLVGPGRETVSESTEFRSKLQLQSELRHVGTHNFSFGGVLG